MNRAPRPSLIWLTCALSLAACGGASDEDGPLDSAPHSISLQFEGRVGSQLFQCGNEYTDVGTSHATATAGDLRFFVHGIRFSKGSGESSALVLDDRDPWQGSQVGLIDLEDKTGECQFGTPATNDVLTGQLPAGDYDQIAFEIGVPDEQNHLNVETAGAPFAASKLQWDWANGFIHFASQLNSTQVIEDETGQGLRVPSFYSHLGSTECAGANPNGEHGPTCLRKNRPSVSLPHFDPTRDKIVIDLAQLFSGSNLDENTADTIPGCMSGPNDPECEPVFEQLGVDLASGAVSADRSQKVFSGKSR